jgi:peptidoglycan/xylan/chitin deacetylase (PgdA/CDA1 family)
MLNHNILNSNIVRYALILTLMLNAGLCSAQSDGLQNERFLQKLYADTSYTNLKNRIDKLFAHALPGHWGEFVKGVDEDLITRQKTIALTFDACGGPHGSGYDRELIDYLIRENIPATLFFSGKWIDANPVVFRELARNPLFEIENHGFNHRPCSVDGESEYGIHGTADVPDAFDEIEANERKIEAITGRRPEFFRSATAFIDESCAKIAKCLHVTVISFDVLSGDAIPHAAVATLENNVLSKIKPGAIVIMHLNHPEWNTYEALVKIIPALIKEGYTFGKLADYPLKGR